MFISPRSTTLIVLTFLVVSASAVHVAAPYFLRQITYSNKTAHEVSLALNSTGGMHMVWWEGVVGKGRVFHQFGDTAGWTERQEVSWDQLATSRVINIQRGDVDVAAPVIVLAPSDTGHIVWVQTYNGYSDLHYATIIDGILKDPLEPRIFADETDLGIPEFPQANDNRPKIGITSKGRVVLAWERGDPPWVALTVQHSFDVFEWPQRLSLPGKIVSNPSLVVGAGDAISVVWSEEGPTGVWSTMLSDSTGLLTLSTTAAPNKIPAIAVSASGEVHVAWWEAKGRGLRHVVLPVPGRITSDIGIAAAKSGNSLSIAVVGSVLLELVWRSDATDEIVGLNGVFRPSSGWTFLPPQPIVSTQDLVEVASIGNIINSVNGAQRFFPVIARVSDDSMGVWLAGRDERPLAGVLLSDVTATITGGGVGLGWRVEYKTAEDYRMRIERRQSVNAPWITLATLRVREDISSYLDLSGVGTELQPKYRLTLYADGVMVAQETVTPGPKSITPSISLQPNPFNSGITLSSTEKLLSIEIFDLLGRSVASYSAASGDHLGLTWRWDGRDRQARELATGVYLLRVSLRDRNGEEFSSIRRITLLR